MPCPTASRMANAPSAVRIAPAGPAVSPGASRRPMNRLVPTSSATNGERGERQQIVARAGLGHLPAVDHDQPVAEHQGLHRAVGDVHRDAATAAGADSRSSSRSTRAGLQVERRERLVQQEQPRVEHQRAGQRGALLLPARELARQAQRQLGDPHQVERVAAPALGPRAAGRPEARSPNATFSRT